MIEQPDDQKPRDEFSDPRLTPPSPALDQSTILWKGPGGWLVNSSDGTVAQPTITLIVDEVEKPTAEFGTFALDDAVLSRLVSLVDSGAAVELVNRAPFVRPDPTPAEVAEINARADEIRDTMGDRAAQEYLEERLGGTL